MMLGQPTPKRKALLNAGAFPGASRVPVGCFALFGSSIGYHTGRALSEGVTHRLFRYVFCFLRHARRACALMQVGALCPGSIWGGLALLRQNPVEKSRRIIASSAHAHVEGFDLRDVG